MNLGSAEIVVTGLGLVTPLGNGREKTWARLVNGETGIQRYASGLEARVLDFSLNGARSRMGDFAVLAAGEALEQAGISREFISQHVVGCSVSQSKPTLSTNFGAETPDSQLLLSSFFGWSAPDVVRRHFKLNGPSMNVVAACATGVASLAAACHWLNHNEADVVLAGSAESSLHDLYRQGFRQMGVLCEGNPSDVRPFDRHRSGFAMGEGAAVFVLEKKKSAELRGAQPLASLSAIHLGHSFTDSIRFDGDGSAVADLIKQVTKGLKPDYVNAHGTGTILNDSVESKGITQAFGRGTRVSSTKSATGHLLGAAGAVEAAFSVLALHDQTIPGTVNLAEPDEACHLGHVYQSEKGDYLTAMSLSYGFGGQMAAVLFSRYE